ncbi:MAG: helix-turn-helix domain-containing protein [Clostridia bacterium]|nr:helix-turn-helix domain-containing protein [Clostridia bacterium]MBR2908595.1 helix-turn-helix domain-containing protein [Clostridia bacterium]
MESYIDRIKKMKNERKITNQRLSEMTGIPIGTLSKILAGISDSPKLANIISICDALGCSIDYIVTGREENPNNYLLDDGEIQLIENYRTLDDHGKELVVLVLDKEKERLTREAYGIGSGSVTGRARVLERPMVYSGSRDLCLYDLPVSAGPGEFLDGAEFQTIHVPDGPVTRTASYALRISGDSMNPRYKDGDILMVQKCDHIEQGELGIFVLDNAGYFKKYGGDRLISLNPDYEDILLSRFEQVQCCGRVLGKLKRK